MNKENFFSRFGGKAVNCKTEKEAQLFCSLAYSFGFKWPSGRTDSHWQDEKENTCYILKSNLIQYDSMKYYMKNGKEVVRFLSATEVLAEMGYEYKEHLQGHRFVHKTDGDYIDVDLFRNCWYHFQYIEDELKPFGSTLELTEVMAQVMRELGFE